MGTTVRFSWIIDFESPDLQLWQDNYPGDAQGGANVVIEGTTLSFFVRRVMEVNFMTTKRESRGLTKGGQ